MEDEEVIGEGGPSETGTNMTSLSTCGGVHYSIERGGQPRLGGQGSIVDCVEICMYVCPALPPPWWCQTADDNGVPPRITMWVDSGIGTRGRTNQASFLPSLSLSSVGLSFLRSLPDIINITSPLLGECTSNQQPSRQPNTTGTLRCCAPSLGDGEFIER